MVVLSDFQTFHAPSFGEDDFKFEIPAITLPVDSGDCSEQPSSDCLNTEPINNNNNNTNSCSNNKSNSCLVSTAASSPAAASSPNNDCTNLSSTTPSSSIASTTSACSSSSSSVNNIISSCSNNINNNNNNSICFSPNSNSISSCFSNSSNNSTSPASGCIPPANFSPTNGTQPLSHPNTFIAPQLSPCYSTVCNGIRPPPAYGAQPQLVNNQLYQPQGGVHLQSNCPIYPPQQQQQQQYLHPQQQQQIHYSPQHFYPQQALPTSHGLHYLNNPPNPVVVPDFCTGAQNLPHFSQFIPPALMQQQQREPILQSMAAGGDKMGLVLPPGYQMPGSSPSTLTSPSRDSDSSDDTSLSQLSLKRTAPNSQITKPTNKKPKPSGGKKKKKKDPNEPQKPVSAYALFFRDTQAAIKNQNQNATFGEVSKIVASMWDGLDEETKSAYKKRTEVAKKEYLKQLAAYRASLVQQGAMDPAELDKSPQISPERSNQSSPPHNTQQQNNDSGSHNQTTATTTVVVATAAAARQQQQQTTSPPPPLSHSPPSVPPPAVSVVQQQNTCSPGVGTVTASHMSMQPTGQQQVMGFITQPGMEPTSFYGTAQAVGPVGQVGGPGLVAPGPMDQSMASMCIRTGCEQPAVNSPNWDNEYCSNDCVVDHCRDVFTAWVAQRQAPGSTYASVK